MFDDDEHAAELFGLEAEPMSYADAYTGKTIYSPSINPTTVMLENRLATLEGGIGCMATASGVSSLDLATFLLAESGDSIVTVSALYGDTYTYLTHRQSPGYRDTLDYEGYAGNRRGHRPRPRRDNRQPGAGHARHRATGRYRPRERRSAVSGQQLRHPLPYLCNPFDYGRPHLALHD